MRPSRWTLFLATGLATLLAAAACGGSSPASTGAAPQLPTYTIGLLTDLTGPASDVEIGSPLGVKAGIGLAAQDGYTLKLVTADTGTNPTQALSAVRKLVEQDHVFAVIAASAVTFAAANYLTAKGIPVVGANEDGPEWITSRNMFSIFGTQDFTKVQTTYGLLLKKLDATTIGAVGTGVSPSSAESAKATALSAQKAGLRVGYLNATLPFGTTDVTPVALAMKAAGVDGVITTINTTTSLALVAALRLQGVTVKAGILPTGYGGDLLHAGPGAAQAAQGLYFLTSYEPVEMGTPATKRFQEALKTYAGVTDAPTFGEYIGYLSVDGFVAGLKAAGAKPTQASFINAMLGIDHYDGAGLFGSHSIGFGMAGRGQTAGPENCVWVSKFTGSTFHPVTGATPLCGSLIPGQTVSAS